MVPFNKLMFVERSDLARRGLKNQSHTNVEGIRFVEHFSHMEMALDLAGGVNS
jgi:hypothetical protein